MPCMPNEADTCRQRVVPKLQADGCDSAPHTIVEQRMGQHYGQGKPGLKITNIRPQKLPFPSLAAQHCIVAELPAPPATLDRAFKGEL